MHTLSRKLIVTRVQSMLCSKRFSATCEKTFAHFPSSKKNTSFSRKVDNRFHLNRTPIIHCAAGNGDTEDAGIGDTGDPGTGDALTLISGSIKMAATETAQMIKSGRYQIFVLSVIWITPYVFRVAKFLLELVVKFSQELLAKPVKLFSLVFKEQLVAVVWFCEKVLQFMPSVDFSGLAATFAVGLMLLGEFSRYSISYLAFTNIIRKFSSKKAVEKMDEEPIVGTVFFSMVKDAFKEILIGTWLTRSGFLRVGDYIHFGSTKGIVTKLDTSYAKMEDDLGFEVVFSYSDVRAKSCRISHFLRRSMTIKLVLSRPGLDEVSATLSKVKHKIMTQFCEVLDKTDNEWISIYIFKREGFTRFVTLEDTLKKVEKMSQLHKIEDKIEDLITAVILEDNEDNLYCVDRLDITVN